MYRSSAALSPSEASPTEKIPFWLWPTILSLDAPIVAVVWLGAFAAAFAVDLRWSTMAALGLAVWVIYAADRLLDGLAAPYPGEPERHRFYRRHRVSMIPVLAAATAAAVALGLIGMPFAVIRNEAALGLIVVIYFAIIHAAGSRRTLWPKELAVAVIFAAGVVMPVITPAAPFRGAILAAAALFAAVCWINTIAIECWENAPDPAARAGLSPAVTRLLAQYLRWAALAVALFALALMLLTQAPLYGAIAVSALILAVLEFSQDHLARAALRVMADAALLTPLIFLLLR